jgi:hypothetical protein
MTASDVVSSSTTLYVFTPATGSCLAAENSFVITITTTPVADAPAAVFACGSYTLPALTNGNYFTGQGGTGTAMTAGDVVSSSTTLYVFTPATGSCLAAENSFVITITPTPMADAPADVFACGSYTLPALTNGNYFTGQGGTGTAMTASDVVSSSTTLYVFTPATGSCLAAENSFVITITPTPMADAPADVFACGSYTLPALTNGNYYTAPGGTGTVMTAGDVVSSSTTLYVFTPATGSCLAAENSFTITINTATVAVITNNTGTNILTCSTTTISLTASGGTSYAWNNGLGNNASVQITSPGTYQVIVTNANGCSASSSIVITQAPAIGTVTASAGTITTIGGTTTLTVNVTGGQTPFTYSLNGGAYQFANTFTVGAGTYTVTVKDANGCIQNSNTVIVTQPSLVTTSLTYTGTLSVQYGATANLSATLKDSQNRPISGKSIVFAIGSQSATSTTNGKGIATASLIITQVPGSYPITATFDGDAVYSQSVENTHTLAISRKPVTASLIGTVTKKYDGNTTAYMSSANYYLPGLISGDVVSLNNPALGTYNNNKVGSGKKVTVTGLSLTGTNSGNYMLSSTTASANIGIITALKSAEILPDVTAGVPSVEFPTLEVYPNPFTEKLNIEFSSPIDTHAKIEVFNLVGAKLEILFDHQIKGGQSYNVEYLPHLVSSQMVIYRLTMNGEIRQGKMMYQERR